MAARLLKLSVREAWLGQDSVVSLLDPLDL